MRFTYNSISADKSLSLPELSKARENNLCKICISVREFSRFIKRLEILQKLLVRIKFLQLFSSTLLQNDLQILKYCLTDVVRRKVLNPMELVRRLSSLQNAGDHLSPAKYKPSNLFSIISKHFQSVIFFEIYLSHQ